MKIGIIGYGKMGKAIERIALDSGHEIVAILDENDESFDTLKKADVAIEFTSPSSAFNNLKKCIDVGVPVLSGTTGWLDQQPALIKYCKEHDGTYFYASNYSIGVNLFFKINELVAELMNSHTEYQPHVEEIHHVHKKDSPSGTGITLAERMLKHLTNKKNWLEGDSTNSEDLSIYSKREGEVPGTHSAVYASEMDNITLTHTAYTRDSFALGAIKVAEWLKNKKGILTMSDFMGM